VPAALLCSLNTVPCASAAAPLPSELVSLCARWGVVPRFKTFNMAFEELHRTQCLWKIPPSHHSPTVLFFGTRGFRNHSCIPCYCVPGSRRSDMAFEELHRTQCLWKIPDEELCSAVQLQIAEVLMPAYRSFVTRYK